jgi:hypothetical protein
MSIPVSATTVGTPTVTVTLRQGESGYSGTADNSMISVRDGDNIGGDGTIAVGRHGTGADLVTDVQRSLVRFDLSAIPPGTTILSARLALYNKATESQTPSSVGAYRLTKHWVEGTRTGLPSPESGASCWRSARLNQLNWSAGARTRPATPRRTTTRLRSPRHPEATATLAGAERLVRVGSDPGRPRW